VAWSDEAKPWMASGPTGAAMRSILEWIRSYAQ
jgi:leucyl aminopeptidase